MPERALKGDHQVVPPHAQLSWTGVQDHRLTPTARLVLWALCYWAWGRRADCWPSNEQIGNLIGRSPRTVQLRLGELARTGHVYRKMVKSARGWHRVLTLAERYLPELAMVEPPGGGGVTGCATPGVTDCATPAKPVALPVAQPVTHQVFEDPEREKKELASIVESPGGDTPTPGQPEGEGETEEEPTWLRVDHAADLEFWRRILEEPGHAMRRLAVKIFERHERHEREGNGLAPGSPTKDPRGPAIEGP